MITATYNSSFYTFHSIPSTCWVFFLPASCIFEISLEVCDILCVNLFFKLKEEEFSPSAASRGDEGGPQLPHMAQEWGQWGLQCGSALPEDAFGMQYQLHHPSPKQQGRPSISTAEGSKALLSQSMLFPTPCPDCYNSSCATNRPNYSIDLLHAGSYGSSLPSWPGKQSSPSAGTPRMSQSSFLLISEG